VVLCPFPPETAPSCITEFVDKRCELAHKINKTNKKVPSASGCRLQTQARRLSLGPVVLRKLTTLLSNGRSASGPGRVRTQSFLGARDATRTLEQRNFFGPDNWRILSAGKDRDIKQTLKEAAVAAERLRKLGQKDP
jgi:hypothetical protein